MNVVSLPERWTVGGSDCAAAAGIHPFTSPVALWLEKTGRAARPVTEAMEWGTMIEPLIVERLRDDYADVFYAPAAGADPWEIRSDAHPWFVAHPEGMVGVDGVRAVLEVKTANVWAHRHGWADDVPVQYAAQAQWYMHATGLDLALIACLVGGQRLETRVVRRSDRAIALLLEAAERFVGFCRRDTPPPPDGSESTRDALVDLFPSARDGHSVRLTGEAWRAMQELRALRAQAKVIDGQVTERENIVKMAMGDAESAVDPHDREVCRWSNVTARRMDTTGLRKAYPDVVEAFTHETTSRRFTVV